MFKTTRRQKGLSFTGLAFILIVLGVIVLAVLRLLPIYTEHFAIMRTLEQTKSLPESKSMSPSQLQSQLMKTFYVNDVKLINSANFKDYIEIVKTGGATEMNLIYQRDAPFMKNVFLLVKFEEQVIIE
jgi:hypothetical protein